VSISVVIDPPHVTQRPGWRGGMATTVERPHEKQYSRQ
jgi:hypothetical protein